MSHEGGHSPEAEARKRIEEERKHSLRVARVSIIPATITALATVLAALIGVLWKADTVGAKVNAQSGQPANVMSNLHSGWNTLASLTDPNKPLSSAIPQCAPDIKPSAPIQPASPNQPANVVPSQIPPAADISTDPTVLASCYGLGSFKPKSVRVLAGARGGYSISMRLHNEGPTEVLYVEQPQLTDAKQTVAGFSSIPTGPFYVAKTMDARQLLEIYSGGTTISGNDDGSVNFNFQTSPVQGNNQSVTFGATFLHFTKADDGGITRLSTPMTCQAIPVVKSP